MPEIPFGPYTLLRRIAVGGMSEVFLARSSLAEGRTVVVKQILPQLARDPDLLQLFFDEAALAKRLHHPGIVEVFDFGDFEGTHFLTMEYVDGLDLDELEKTARVHGGIGQDRAVHVVRRLSQAVAYAHAAADEEGRPLELVHRDISPQNVFLGVDGAVKLGDFGIARTRLRAMRTETGVLRGKMAYLAPERLMGAEATQAVDVYAIGVVLYEALAGRKPFGGDEVQMVRAILNDVPPPIEGLFGAALDLGTIVARAMAKRPEDRIPTAAALAALLEPFDRPETAATLGAYVAERKRERDLALAERKGSARPAQRGTETLPGMIEPDPAPAVTASVLHEDAPTVVDRQSVVPAIAAVEAAPPTEVVFAHPEATRPALALDPAMRRAPPPPPKRSLWRMAVVLAAGLGAGLLGARLLVPPPPPSPKLALEPIELGPTEIEDAQASASPTPSPTPAVTASPEPSGEAAPRRPRRSPRATPSPSASAKAREESGFGELSLDAEPWGNVSVDGRGLGPTPLAHVRLSAGTHRVSIENPEQGLSKAITVTVKADQRTTLRVRLGGN
ncbi:MAG: serine/threonine-protein kinase [Myxococcota bacterium]